MQNVCTVPRLCALARGYRNIVMPFGMTFICTTARTPDPPPSRDRDTQRQHGCGSVHCALQTPDVRPPTSQPTKPNPPPKHALSSYQQPPPPHFSQPEYMHRRDLTGGSLHMRARVSCVCCNLNLKPINICPLALARTGRISISSNLRPARTQPERKRLDLAPTYAHAQSERAHSRFLRPRDRAPDQTEDARLPESLNKQFNNFISTCINLGRPRLSRGPKHALTRAAHANATATHAS